MKMRTFLQNKLWRDKIVKKLEGAGSCMQVRILDDATYDNELRIKLIEEAEEVKNAQSQHALIEELADVFEVIDALCALHGITLEDIKCVQEEKRNERGGFFERIFVEKAMHPIGSFGEQYCLAALEKYPEIIE
jgi:predicted house-cleaning noncanonical NTP pyrophosphatase (MazG superfamily)